MSFQRLFPSFPLPHVGHTIAIGKVVPILIYSNDFSDYVGTFESKFLSNLTRTQEVGEVREYWINVTGLAKGGAASASLTGLGSIRDYSLIDRIDLLVLHGATPPGSGDPRTNVGVVDALASYHTTYGFPISHAIYAFIRNEMLANEDELEIRAYDAAGTLYATRVIVSPAERYGTKETFRLRIDIGAKEATAWFPLGTALEISVTLTGIPDAVFDAITDMRFHFGSWLYVYTGYTGSIDNYFDEVEIWAF